MVGMCWVTMVITHLPFDRCDRPNIAIDPHVVLVFNKTIGLTDLQREIAFYIYQAGITSLPIIRHAIKVNIALAPVY